MKKLIAFGDSWTHGHGVEPDIKYKEVGNPGDFIFQLRLCNSWPRWLANKLDLPFLNFGYPGSDNIHIANCIDMFLNNLSKDDLIIVMLSFPYRHTFRKETENISLQSVIERIQKQLDGLDYYIFNSFCPTFYDEPNTKSKLDLTRFICVDTTAADILNKYEIENNISVWEYESRKVYDDKQNLYEGDYHPNLLGYKLISEWIYQELKNKDVKGFK
jgi:hypothetical protein